MTYDATAQTYIPTGAKPRWGREVLAAGNGDFPRYSGRVYRRLPAAERRLAWRQYVVFGNGPYADAQASGSA